MVELLDIPQDRDDVELLLELVMTPAVDVHDVERPSDELDNVVDVSVLHVIDCVTDEQDDELVLQVCELVDVLTVSELLDDDHSTSAPNALYVNVWSP